MRSFCKSHDLCSLESNLLNCSWPDMMQTDVRFYRRCSCSLKICWNLLFLFAWVYFHAPVKQKKFTTMLIACKINTIVEVLVNSGGHPWIMYLNVYTLVNIYWSGKKKQISGSWYCKLLLFNDCWLC